MNKINKMKHSSVEWDSRQVLARHSPPSSSHGATVTLGLEMAATVCVFPWVSRQQSVTLKETISRDGRKEPHSDSVLKSNWVRVEPWIHVNIPPKKSKQPTTQTVRRLRGAGWVTDLVHSTLRTQECVWWWWGHVHVLLCCSCVHVHVEWDQRLLSMFSAIALFVTKAFGISVFIFLLERTCIWKLKDDLAECFLLRHVVSGDWTQVPGLGGKCFFHWDILQALHLIFFTLFSILCMCVHFPYAMSHVWKAEDNLWGSVFPLRGSWELNSSGHVWQQAPLLTKPYCQLTQP